VAEFPDPAALAALPRITVEGRTFRYEARPGEDPPPGKPEGPCWWLYGARGAVYFTVRSVPRPDRMFLVNGKTMSQPFPRTWLTDSDGQLKVLS
jgi:hypothetical protein